MVYDNVYDREGNMDAYTTIMRRITAIVKRSNDDAPRIIEDYAWHLTTILNTFNAYHCYDVSLEKQREIEPIWLDMMLKRGSTIVRLLSIMIESKYSFTFLLESKIGAIRYYFAYDAFVQSNPVFVQNENGYDTRINKTDKLDTVTISTSYKDVSTTDVRFRMPPLYTDLAYTEKESIFEVTENDNSYKNYEIYVNLKYVHPYRVLYGNDTGKLFENTARGTRLTNIASYMEHYLFGVDWSYIEENFSGDVYVPRTRINISDVEPRNKDVCFTPTETEKSLPVHDKEPYIDSRNTQIIQMIMQEYVSESVLIDITNHLRRVNDSAEIPDIISLPSIDPTYRFSNLINLENRHYELRHHLMDIVSIIDDATDRIKNLLMVTYSAS